MTVIAAFSTACQSGRRAAIAQRSREVGCVVEQGFGTFGVAVPPRVDREQLLDLLNAACDRGELSYEAEF
jgi:hypothetical protein